MYMYCTIYQWVIYVGQYVSMSLCVSRQILNVGIVMRAEALHSSNCIHGRKIVQCTPQHSLAVRPTCMRILCHSTGDNDCLWCVLRFVYM